MVTYDWKIFVSVEEVHENFTLSLGPFLSLQFLRDFLVLPWVFTALSVILDYGKKY